MARMSAEIINLASGRPTAEHTAVERGRSFVRRLDRLADLARAGAFKRAVTPLPLIPDAPAEPPRPQAKRRAVTEGGATRRAVLSAIPVLAAAERLPASHPDAALIADCDELATALDRFNASGEDATDADVLRWNALERRIIAAPTRTPEGVLARVRALAASNGDFGGCFDEPGQHAYEMLAAIFRAVKPELAAFHRLRAGDIA